MPPGTGPLGTLPPPAAATGVSPMPGPAGGSDPIPAAGGTSLTMGLAPAAAGGVAAMAEPLDGLDGSFVGGGSSTKAVNSTGSISTTETARLSFAARFSCFAMEPPDPALDNTQAPTMCSAREKQKAIWKVQRLTTSTPRRRMGF